MARRKYGGDKIFLKLASKMVGFWRKFNEFYGLALSFLFSFFLFQVFCLARNCSIPGPKFRGVL